MGLNPVVQAIVPPGLFLETARDFGGAFGVSTGIGGKLTLRKNVLI